VITVARLTRRLADTPRDFLVEPDQVSVAAVVSDVLRMAGGSGLSAALPGLERNAARLVLITCWLAADEELVAAGDAARLRELLTTGLDRLAGLVDAEKFVSDPDRRPPARRSTAQYFFRKNIGAGATPHRHGGEHQSGKKTRKHRHPSC